MRQTRTTHENEDRENMHQRRQSSSPWFLSPWLRVAWITVLLLALVLVVLGCDGDDTETETLATVTTVSVPDSFPDLELPEDSRAITAFEEGDGGVLDVSYVSSVPPEKQYEHFLGVLADAGYEVQEESLNDPDEGTDGDATYSIYATNDSESVSISGSGGDEEFPNAFNVTVRAN